MYLLRCLFVRCALTLGTWKLINDPDVEAVVICSPTDQHADQIMAAARAGKTIFCEKPISLSLEIIDEVCSVGKELALMLGATRFLVLLLLVSCRYPALEGQYRQERRNCFIGEWRASLALV